MRAMTKLIIITVLLFLTNVVVGNYLLNQDKIDILKTTISTLQNVLDFVEEKYDKFHFDGLFGVTFSHTFLLKILKMPIQKHIERDINNLINKCEKIHNKIYPLLPDKPRYMITFRKNILNARKWNNVLTDNFSFGALENLGFYANWTAEIIINNKKASYKGVKSDVCLREILESSSPKGLCFVSSICEEMMLDESRIDTGYLMTHRLLYLQIIKLYGCTFPPKYQNIRERITKLCSYIYKEARTSEKLNFPHYDIFLEQVVLCGMEGYSEFFNGKWFNNILHWQNPHGCYKNLKQNLMRRTSFQVGFGCSDHTTGLGAAALALHLRYLLYTLFTQLYM